MEFVRIGTIINTHGIKGELKIENHSDFIEERYEKGSYVYIGEQYIKETVKTYRIHQGYVLLLLEGKENINLIEKYKGLEIYKDSSDIKPLKEGYYFKDLVGLDVYQSDKKVGCIMSCEEGVKSNFIRILKEDKKEVLVPFLDNFILNVDLESNRLDIVEMEGLLWK